MQLAGVISGKMVIIHLTWCLAWIGLASPLPTMAARPKENYKICSSTVCLQRAKEIKASLNQRVNPCNDFYTYACGGWRKKHSIPESKSSYGTFNILDDELRATLRDILGNMTLVKYGKQNVTDKVAILYKACLAHENRTDQMTVVKEIMRERGLSEWPIMSDKKCNASHSNWTEVLMKAGVSHVLGIYIGRDSKHNSSYVLQLDQISFGSVGRNQLIHPNKTENAKIIKAYKKLIVEAIKLMSPSTSKSRVKELTRDLVDFEGKLANLTAPPEERRDILKLYRRTTIKELQKNFSSFPLLSLLNREFNKINLTLNESEPLEMYGLDYYSKLETFLQKMNRTTFFNYVGLNTMLYWATTATQSIRNASFELTKATTGVKRELERWEKCVGSAKSGMPDAIGNLYVKNKFSKEAKTEVEYFVKKMKEVFQKTLRTARWMDVQTKRQAYIKLKTMRSKIGYPEWILNSTHLQLLYKHVPNFHHNSSYLSMWKSITRNNWIITLQTLRLKYDPNAHWSGGPAVVNAFYNPEGNEMLFPSGILQGAFYQRGLPRSINFGAIGTIIGHELTHGFDDTGSQYDAYGGLRMWWTNSTRTKFDKKAKCFENQYGKIFDKEANMTLNGKNTVGENIADNGGLRTAFLAYTKFRRERGKHRDIRLKGLEELSGEKLFFIANGMVWCGMERKAMLRELIQYDGHSPLKYRVNIPMKNMPLFARVFNCPSGSPMNPRRNETCSLW